MYIMDSYVVYGILDSVTLHGKNSIADDDDDDDYDVVAFVVVNFVVVVVFIVDVVVVFKPMCSLVLSLS